MVTLASLWLPILVSGVVIFFASFVMWMMMPHHKSDYTGLPDEDGLMDHLRSQGAGAGQYLFPHCVEKEQWSSPEFKKKYEEGPTGMLLIRSKGSMNMGKNMAQSICFNLIVSIFVAYVASFVFSEMAEGIQVFRLTSIIAFLGYSGGLAWGAIWWGFSWSSTLKGMFDGLVYGLLTGLIFMLLW